MAASTDPLARRHGIGLFSAQTTFGTPVTPATGIGIASLTWTELANPVYFTGPGSPDPVAMRPGCSWVEWSLEIEGLQTGAKTLFQKVQRASGVVPWITLGLGYADDTGTPVVLIDQIQDCKVEKVSLTVDRSRENSPVSAQISGIGTKVVELTSGAAALLTTTPWMSQDAILTRAGGAFPAQSITVDIMQTLSRDYTIPGSAPVRTPTSITEHDQEYSGTLTRYHKAAVTLNASTLAEAAFVLTLTNPVDSVALTLTYANQTFGKETRTVGSGIQTHVSPWRARSLVIS